jgi:hypothetical protein
MLRRRSVREAAQFGASATLLIACIAAAASEARADDTLITITTGSGAFAQGFFNSAIRDNVVVDVGNESSSVLESSILGTRGIVQFNQDSGIGTNQANMVIISVAAGATNPVPWASFQGHIEISGNTVTLANVTRTNTMQNILDGAVGIVQINQNTGNLNTNFNGLAIAIGLGQGNAVITLGDGHLSATATNNQININGPVTLNTTVSGISNVAGIGQINMTNGDANIAANTMTITVNFMTIQ